MKLSTPTRRKLIVAAGATALPRGWGTARAAADNMVHSAAKITKEFGRNGGIPFGMEYPESVGVRSSNLINALLLNSVQHGGDSGDNPTSYSLTNDDYWSEFEVADSSPNSVWVEYLSLKSSRGYPINGGPDYSPGEALFSEGYLYYQNWGSESSIS